MAAEAATAAGLSRPGVYDLGSQCVDGAGLQKPPATTRASRQHQVADAPANLGQIADLPGDQQGADLASGAGKPHLAGRKPGDLDVEFIEFLVARLGLGFV